MSHPLLAGTPVNCRWEPAGAPLRAYSIPLPIRRPRSLPLCVEGYAPIPRLSRGAAVPAGPIGNRNMTAHAYANGCIDVHTHTSCAD